MTLDCIRDLLCRASGQASVAWASPQGTFVVSRETAGSLHDSIRVPFLGEKIVRGGEWALDSRAYQDVQDWIETYWRAGQGTVAPTGCVASERPAQFAPRDRLDTPTAARKLIFAAMVHRLEAVAGSAMRFAQTGLLDVESFYLLKGPSIGRVIELDDFCALIPYREAVQFRESLLDVSTPGSTWPPEHADGLCALRARGFESLSRQERMVYMSPLLRQGHPDDVALMLGVVWGDGYTVFGHWHLVPLVTSAALPFWSIGPIGGSFQRATTLRLPIGESYVKKRPLAREELVKLWSSYANLEEQPQKILRLAMRRLRDGAGRIDFEDKVIDLCIALEALFTGTAWVADLKQTISGRASWYYADTVHERDGARSALKELYETRRNIIHGNTTDQMRPWPDAESTSLLAEAGNIVRACLKSMAVSGIPDDWEPSKDHKSIWRDPPRPSSAIPSTKSDSMSWSVEDQVRIDRALKAAWKSSLGRVEPLPANRSTTISIGGISESLLEQYRRERRPFEIHNPAILYTAHPKWPTTGEEDLSERCRYYCHQDVIRHMLEWQQAAGRKNVQQYWLEDTGELHRSHDPDLYHPKNAGSWSVPLP